MRHRLITAPRCRRPVRGGFTLIEMIAVIAVVATLIALLVASFSRARGRSRAALVMSRLSSHAAVFQAYASDYRDCSPYFTDPLATKNVVECHAQDIVETGDYFDACAIWPTALADGYYSGNRISSVFYDAMDQEPTFLWYQRVFIASPGYWNETERLFGRSQWVATKVDDVVFPSHKAWLLNNFHWDSARGRPDQNDGPGRWIVAACVDGHAERVQADRLGREYPASEGSLWLIESRTHLYTIDGVRGRDFQ